jgi:hypothetical protein
MLQITDRTEQHVRARIFACVLSLLLLATVKLELKKACMLWVTLG